MNIRLSRSALLDLREILDWFVEQDSRPAGEAWVARLLDRIQPLERFPESGRIVPEFQLQDLRELIEPPFRIVYRLTSSSITVIRIWRGERQLALPE